MVALGAVLPATPLAGALGFAPLPGGFFVALVGMVLACLVLIEIGKQVFYASAPSPTSRWPHHWVDRHLRRRAAWFSTSRPHHLRPPPP